MLVHRGIEPPHEIKRVKEYEFIIDPNNTEPVETICAYLREIWRIADGLHSDRIKHLAQAAFDKANRMSRGLVDHRRHLLKLPEEYREVEKGKNKNYE